MTRSESPKAAWAAAAVLVSAAAALAGCSVGFGMGVGVTIPVGPRRHAPVYAVEAGETESGLACCVSPRRRGRPTATGELYDPGALTAAHRTLPPGAVVRVRRLDRAASVTVRINDRSVSRGHLIALSAAAGAAIGLAPGGEVPVALRVQDPAGLPPGGVAP